MQKSDRHEGGIDSLLQPESLNTLPGLRNRMLKLATFTQNNTEKHFRVGQNFVSQFIIPKKNSRYWQPVRQVDTYFHRPQKIGPLFASAASLACSATSHHHQESYK
jgi:hypothetical protein